MAMASGAKFLATIPAASHLVRRGEGKKWEGGGTGGFMGMEGTPGELGNGGGTRGTGGWRGHQGDWGMKGGKLGEGRYGEVSLIPHPQTLHLFLIPLRTCIGCYM